MKKLNFISGMTDGGETAEMSERHCLYDEWVSDKSFCQYIYIYIYIDLA